MTATIEVSDETMRMLVELAGHTGSTVDVNISVRAVAMRRRPVLLSMVSRGRERRR